MELPGYALAWKRVKEAKAKKRPPDPLDDFIVEFEPAGDIERSWREKLAALLEHTAAGAAHPHPHRRA